MSTRPSRPTSAISPRPTSVSPTRKFNFSLAPTPSRPTTADFNLRQITTTASSSRQHSRQSSFSLSPQEQTELEQDLRTSLTNHRVSLHHRHQPPIKIQQMKIDYSTALIGVTKSLGKFGIEYAKGGIPCRVSHEGRNKNGNGLKWNIDLSMLESFNPLAITFFIGLEETSHPYTFLVKEGIKDILASTGARRKIIPILPNLINPIRRGLSSVKRENVVVTLNAMRMLSRLCGKEFIPCFAKILPVVQSKAIYGDSDVMNTLNAIEMVIRRDLEGYDQSIVARLIKLYVPTYVAGEVSQNAYGKSLIATNDLPINTIVQEFCGQVVDYETSKPSIRCHLLNYLDKQTGTWKWMNASTDAIYANHSCEPNCELKDCVLRTIKDVKKGQELTFVYNIGLESDYWDPVWSFKCACGSRNCQGEIDRYRKF